MTTPARDAALAQHEQGTGSRLAGTPHSQFLAPVEAGAVIAHLQQRVQAWMDEDRLFPADGASLLAALDRALGGLAGQDAPAARAGVTAFVGQVEALIEARVLEASDGHTPIEAAARLIAGLRSAAATDGETHRRTKDASWAQSRPGAEHSLARSGDEHPSSRSERNSKR